MFFLVLPLPYRHRLWETLTFQIILFQGGKLNVCKKTKQSEKTKPKQPHMLGQEPWLFILFNFISAFCYWLLLLYLCSTLDHGKSLMHTTPETDFPFATKEHSKLIFMFRKRIHTYILPKPLKTTQTPFPCYPRGQVPLLLSGAPALPPRRPTLSPAVPLLLSFQLKSELATPQWFTFALGLKSGSSFAPSNSSSTERASEQEGASSFSATSLCFHVLLPPTRTSSPCSALLQWKIHA